MQVLTASSAMLPSPPSQFVEKQATGPVASTPMSEVSAVTHSVYFIFATSCSGASLAQVDLKAKLKGLRPF